MIWKPLSKSSINGKLTKYVVNRKENDGNGLQSFNAIEENIDFTNLRPFTKYLVQIAACNYLVGTWDGLTHTTGGQCGPLLHGASTASRELILCGCKMGCMRQVQESSIENDLHCANVNMTISYSPEKQSNLCHSDIFK